MTWFALALVLALLALAGLALAPWWAGSMPLPGLSLWLWRHLGEPLSKLLDRLGPDLDLRLLVRAGNRAYARAFAAAPVGQRVIFLPFCLCPPDCPADPHRDTGLVCPEHCGGCRVGDFRRRALEHGYARVYLVPSSRILKNHDLMRSDQFIRARLAELKPQAALGVVCAWHLRHRLLPGHRAGRRGYAGQGHHTALQGLLLARKSCRGAQVDWDRLERLAGLGA